MTSFNPAAGNGRHRGIFGIQKTIIDYLLYAGRGVPPWRLKSMLDGGRGRGIRPAVASPSLADTTVDAGVGAQYALQAGFHFRNIARAGAAHQQCAGTGTVADVRVFVGYNAATMGNGHPCRAAADNSQTLEEWFREKRIASIGNNVGKQAFFISPRQRL